MNDVVSIEKKNSLVIKNENWICPRERERERERDKFSNLLDQLSKTTSKQSLTLSETQFSPRQNYLNALTFIVLSIKDKYSKIIQAKIWKIWNEFLYFKSIRFNVSHLRLCQSFQLSNFASKRKISNSFVFFFFFFEIWTIKI